MWASRNQQDRNTGNRDCTPFCSLADIWGVTAVVAVRKCRQPLTPTKWEKTGYSTHCLPSPLVPVVTKHERSTFCAHSANAPPAHAKEGWGLISIHTVGVQRCRRGL